MAFNIQNFKENLNSYGYIKNNKFEVFIQAPRFMANKTLRVNNRETNINDLNQLLRYRIEQVRMPGVNLLSTDVVRYGIGISQRTPYNAQLFDTTFSVLVDRNTDLWDFWYNWINGIFNFNGQEPNGNNIFEGGRIPTYTTEYKENYATTMMIVLYNDTKEIIKTVNLYNAFPTSIGQIPLAWNETQDLMRIALSITFENYTIVGSNLTNTNIPRQRQQIQ
jgi:hypothetical protein